MKPALTALLLAAIPAWPQSGPKLPPPFATPSVRNNPRVIPRPEGINLKLPAGFEIEEYASGFRTPRYMLQGPSGEILLTESTRTNGAVIALKDKEKKTLLSGLDRPFGLAFWKEYLYVGETTSIKRYKYDSKALTATDGQEVVSLKDFGQGHWTRTVLFDRQGQKMYVSVGSGSNVDAGEPPMRAAINRFNPDGSGHEIFAAGTRNTVGMRWYPNTDDLWAAVQERDLLGDDLVPDYFIKVQKGGFYGWPFAYTGPNEDPRRKGENPELVKKTLVPDVILGAHVAVLDFIFYTGNRFPAEYRGGAFLAFHGSWNRAERVGYSVAFVPFKGGKPAGPPRDFLTGWMLDPKKVEVWGRPVGLLQLPDGSILVTDDGGNKIWRIYYKG
jgi:glucose/arabinose dehydrogenase